MTREELVIDFIRGKEVLDVGSVGEDSSYAFWKFLKKHAISLTGIDLRHTQEEGVVVGNMETHEFNRTFDVIVAGDVLIQTDNQGLFLKNVFRHLRGNGRLILTLPNAKWPTVFLRPSKFQTGWHDRYTLEQILDRNGFEIVGLDFYPGNRYTFRILRALLGFKQAMFVVCAKKL